MEILAILQSLSFIMGDFVTPSRLRAALDVVRFVSSTVLVPGLRRGIYLASVRSLDIDQGFPVQTLHPPGCAVYFKAFVVLRPGLASHVDA